jgi:hypothetical protein
MGTTETKFAERTAAALRRGLTIHPLRPQAKEPMLKEWQRQASRNPETLQRWAESFTDSNYGVVANEEFCILESDNLAELQSRLSRQLPVTYTVAARANRPHLYFRQTAASRAAGNMDAPGILEFKQHDKYVVGEGSIHPTGAVYTCIHNGEIQSIPDWLIADLQRIRQGSGIKMSAVLPTDGRKLGEGERHPALMSACAKLWDGRKSPEQMFDELDAINQQHCEPPKQPHKIMQMVTWIMEREPYEPGGQCVVGQQWASVRADRLIARQIPPRTAIVVEDDARKVLLYERSLNQILSWRGVGKTNFALGLAGAIAGGGKILNFQADRPRKVLYLDGELPLALLQERVRQLIHAEVQENVELFSAECLDRPRPLNLLTEDFDKLQGMIEKVGAEVLFLDSQSTLFSGESIKYEFQEVHQNRMKALRLMGLLVVELHHVGKNGLQRGLSKNDDVLDVQMHLKKVEGWEPGDGLKFEVAYDKVRHQANLDKGYIVTLENGIWQRRDADFLVEVATLVHQGKKIREIAKELDISVGAAHKAAVAVKKRGLDRLNAEHVQAQRAVN